MILDIHTHNPSPDPQAVIDLSASVCNAAEGFMVPEGYSPDQRFSVGIHPWSLREDLHEGVMERVEEAAAHPQVAIIGEAGIDIPNGGPLFRQMIIFKKMIELSEKTGKPLLIHDVKAHEIIIQTHKDLRPSQPWIIHGFRAKPTVAQMMLREGFYLSFGELFNPLTVHNAPADRILAETDESKLPIKEIIHSLSDARGTDLTHVVAENAERIIRI